MTDFSHLRSVDDGERKIKLARESVQALRRTCSGYFQARDEEKKSEERKREAKARQEKVSGFSMELDKLKSLFCDLVSSAEPQQRGYKLEKLVADLFHLFDLDPKASFRVQGEQIDGAFTFDSTDFLFEAKWTQGPIQIQDLDSFSTRVTRRLDNTLGLFLSINGFSSDAIAAHSGGRKVIILIDGSDLMAVLDSRIALNDLLYRKRRHAAQTGDIFLPASLILSC